MCINLLQLPSNSYETAQGFTGLGGGEPVLGIPGSILVILGDCWEGKKETRLIKCLHFFLSLLFLIKIESDNKTFSLIPEVSSKVRVYED